MIESQWSLAEWRNSRTMRGDEYGLEQRLALSLLAVGDLLTTSRCTRPRCTFHRFAHKLRKLANNNPAVSMT